MVCNTEDCKLSSIQTKPSCHLQRQRQGRELACADALPPVAGEAAVGSLLAGWGGSALGPRVHALTAVDHTGQVSLTFLAPEL